MLFLCELAWHLVKRMFFIQLQKQSSNGSRVCIAIELFSVFKLKNWYEMFVLLYVRWFVHTTPCHNWIDRQQNNSIRYFFHFVSLILIHSSGKNRISCRFQFLVALHNSHFFRLVDNFLLCFLSFCLLLICKFWGTLTFFLCNVWYVQGIGSSVKIYYMGIELFSHFLIWFTDFYNFHTNPNSSCMFDFSKIDFEHFSLSKSFRSPFSHRYSRAKIAILAFTSLFCLRCCV